MNKLYCSGTEMYRILRGLVTLAMLAGCSHQPVEQSAAREEPKPSGKRIAAFSVSPAGEPPAQWVPLIIHKSKKPTQYRLVSEQEKTILHARASGASSGLMQYLNVDPITQPWLSWKWRIGSLISSANNFERDAEDSPARIILGFDGDKDKLPFADQILFDTAKLLTGHDFPYATLMYVWENKAPVGTVIPSTRTGRIKMIVAASGSDGIGQWHEFKRNIVEDFEKAFGEKPGNLIGVGVMTDTDNTGEVVDAWYGDIRSFGEQPGGVKQR